VSRVASLAEWLAGGERVPISDFSLFCRSQGTGSWLTLLHGFPTSSWDYARIASDLAQEHRLLLFDFLGFGDSDKPAPYAYRLVEQADLVEALWRRFGIIETSLLAHDYGVSVAQELLARAAEGRLGVTLHGVLFLNGGLYSDLHRARLVQRLLAVPLVGALVGRAMSERAFARSFSRVFARPPDAVELAQHWQAICRRDGLRVQHCLIGYMAERRQHHARWVRALETTSVPLRFAWGLEDPVSGAHVADRVAERLPHAPLRRLEGVGHYPQIEAPSVVTQEALQLGSA
jgi:pimeloyl-ACP methyl ester carboxylesterase